MNISLNIFPLIFITGSTYLPDTHSSRALSHSQAQEESSLSSEIVMVGEDEQIDGPFLSGAWKFISMAVLLVSSCTAVCLLVFNLEKNWGWKYGISFIVMAVLALILCGYWRKHQQNLEVIVKTKECFKRHTNFVGEGGLTNALSLFLCVGVHIGMEELGSLILETGECPKDKSLQEFFFHASVWGAWICVARLLGIREMTVYRATWTVACVRFYNSLSKPESQNRS